MFDEIVDLVLIDQINRTNDIFLLYVINEIQVDYNINF